MHSPRIARKYAAVAVAAAMALALAACGSSGPSNSSSNAKVTLSWWSNATSGSSGTLYGVLQTLMKNYHKAHPNVSLTYVPIQNEQWDTKIQVAIQGKKLPDIFFQRGGGFMATQAKSGELANLAPYIGSWVGELGAGQDTAWKQDGAYYGVPYDLHTVGFWYRKSAFSRAGISSPPTTIPDLETDITKLKAAGIAPIAVGSKDQWPDAFYYDLFVVRECDQSTLTSAIKTDSANYPCFTTAGNELKSFMRSSPFQTAFLNTPSQVGAGSSAGMVADGKAAMELQGDWDASVMQGLVSSSTWSSDTSDLGWFPFPGVPGAPGNPAAMLGGSDGNSCSTSAPEPACADFLEYLDSVPAQKMIVSASLLPANPDAASAVTLPADQQEISANKAAPFVQEYLDLAYPTNVGTALDAAVANFFAKPSGDPSAIITAINNAAARQ